MQRYNISQAIPNLMGIQIGVQQSSRHIPGINKTKFHTQTSICLWNLKSICHLNILTNDLATLAISHFINEQKAQISQPKYRMPLAAKEKNIEHPKTTYQHIQVIRFIFRRIINHGYYEKSNQ